MHKHNIQLDFKGYAKSGIGHCVSCGKEFLFSNTGKITYRVFYRKASS